MQLNFTEVELNLIEEALHLYAQTDHNEDCDESESATTLRKTIARTRRIARS
jgi:hypothetical protein